MKIFVGASRVSELLAQFRCDDLEENVKRLTAALAVDSEALIGITFTPAHELLDIYRYRYSTDEIRESRTGWDEFFSTLEGRDSPTGIASVKIGEVAAIVLFDKEVKSVLAALISAAD
ncbi:hypothetical protein EH183_42770 [Streptomyces sp. CB01881]|uniref:hypothetical protein n=1 Tax=Streptomyces sp. CB01881 TaxID=2078691 RepID=UPI0011DFEC0F|nr:hypothetical protein [Streptomyces sp. CB01881]TYC66435.1 hypothetical protein EH183_42770 [Streptomyces sp. CB01881]